MCECRSIIDTNLKPSNARLAFGFMVSDTMNVSPPMIALEKINPKGKKPPILVATYCPFCGDKYKESK